MGKVAENIRVCRSPEHNRIKVCLFSQAFTFRWHVVLLDNSSNLRLETHVKHTIGLIEAEVSAVVQADLSSVEEVSQSTGSGDEQVAASVKISHLSANISTAVDDAGSDMGSVREFSGFIVDLRSQLSSGRKDEREWIELSSTSVAAAAVLFGAVARSTVEDAGKHGEQEGGGLSGTSLGARHEISPLVDDRNGVLLDGGGGRVVGELDRFVDDLAEVALLKGADASWWVFTSHFCGDVIVLFEVDARVGAFEELLLESFVSW